MENKSEVIQHHDPVEDREVAIECLRAARPEVSDRIQLREKTLAAHFVGVISIVGFVVSKDVATSTRHSLSR